MDDAELDLAVEGALFSGFGTAGQRCTSLGTVIVQDTVHDAFMERFAAAVQQAPIGDPTEGVLYGPMIHERFHQRFLDWLELVRDHHTLYGSTGTGRISSTNPREGFVGDPDVGHLRPSDDRRRRARRGRALQHRDLRAFGRRGDAFPTSRRRSRWPTGTATACRRRSTPPSPQHAFRFRERCSAGMISINNSTSGAEAHLPFGGNGKSGNGSRQSGVWVLDQFTRWQSVNWDYAGRLQKAQMETADISADLGFRL